MGVCQYRFVRRYLERSPQLPLSLPQVDLLIRQLTGVCCFEGTLLKSRYTGADPRSLGEVEASPKMIVARSVTALAVLSTVNRPFERRRKLLQGCFRVIIYNENRRQCGLEEFCSPSIGH